MKKEPFIFYSQDVKELPRVTVVGNIVDNKLLIAVSRCSAVDKFEKKIGLRIAKERLSKNELVTQIQLDTNYKLSYYEFIQIAQQVANAVIMNGIKPIVIYPYIAWGWLSEETSLALQEIGVISEEKNKNLNIDDDGFLIYDKNK